MNRERLSIEMFSTDLDVELLADYGDKCGFSDGWCKRIKNILQEFRPQQKRLSK